MLCHLLIALLLVQGPGNASTLDQARALLKQNKIENALTVLRSIELADPKTPGLAREMGVALYRKGDHAAAVPYLQRAISANGNDPEAKQLLGLCYFFIARPAAAIPLLKEVQSWYPVANVDASYVLGVAYLQTKDFENARHAFATMYGVPQESAASYLFTARMMLRQGFDVPAEDYAKKAVAADPKLPMAHYLLGELYTFKSRIDEAAKEFQAELAINPANASVYYKLADALSRQMKFEDAQRLLQRSIWLDSTASGPYILMGKVLLRKNEPDLAARMLQQAITMDPNNYIGHFLLGQAYRTLGRTQESERELKLSEQLQSAQNRSAEEKAAQP